MILQMACLLADFASDFPFVPLSEGMLGLNLLLLRSHLRLVWHRVNRDILLLVSEKILAHHRLLLLVKMIRLHHRLLNRLLHRSNSIL